MEEDSPFRREGRASTPQVQDGETKAANHTPGPWQLSPGWTPNPRAVVDGQNIYGGPRIGVVARVVMAAQDGENLEERAANARLISAAPDLLEALRGFVAYHDRLAGMSTDELLFGDGLPKESDLREAGRAALRKATVASDEVTRQLRSERLGANEPQENQ